MGSVGRRVRQQRLCQRCLRLCGEGWCEGVREEASTHGASRSGLRRDVKRCHSGVTLHASGIESAGPDRVIVSEAEALDLLLDAFPVPDNVAEGDGVAAL